MPALKAYLDGERQLRDGRGPVGDGVVPARAGRRPLLRHCLVPAECAPLLHLLELAAKEGKHDEIESLAGRYLELDPNSSEALLVRLIRAFALGESEARERVINDVYDRGLAPIAIVPIALGARDLQGARRLAQLQVQSSTSSPQERAEGHVWLAQFAMAKGRWEEAKRELSSTERLDPAPGLAYRVLFSVAPFLPVPRSELVALRDLVQRWDTRSVPLRIVENSFFQRHQGMYPPLQTYLLAF